MGNIKAVLTKDANKLLYLAYKEYLQRVKSGVPKPDAKYFDESDSWPASFDKHFSKRHLRDTLSELQKHGFVKRYIRGFKIESSAIVYFNSCFKDKILFPLNLLKELVKLFLSFFI